ncbi:MAG TPA: site-2 protease family protein [Acidimicrobiales bacterium]|nr:site-2 protease family protein [Acidimicrobiales bacterium]
MRGAVKIGKIAGVPIKVHWSFSFLILVLVAYEVESSHATWPTVWRLIVWFAALFASVTVHELAHCAVARRRGLTVRDIVLLPIGGVSEINGLPAAPKTERDIAIAGPATSFLLAILLGLAELLSGGRIWPPALTALPLLADLAWMNLLLCGFNLLPALPMDGGRVLRAILAGRGDPLKATRIASSVAVVLGAAMILVGLAVYPDIFLVFIGAFVMIAANGERRAATVQASFNGLRVGDVMARDPTTVLAAVTVQQLLPWLQAYPGRAVPIVENARYLGIAAVEDLVLQPWATVGEACDKTAPVLDASQPLYPAALEAFSRVRRNQLAVMSGGQVVGVLYRWTLQAVVRQHQGPMAAAQRGGTRAA